MPFITSFERIGAERGRQEGQTALIVRSFKRRWGSLSPELEDRLSKLSLDQLEEWGDTILEFRDPSDLQRWLDEA